MSAKAAFLLTGLLLWGAGCHAGHATQVPPATPETVLDSGQASWYGPRHVGLRTFSGERFDPRRMTAAHASLAMGTMVRVTDMASGGRSSCGSMTASRRMACAASTSPKVPPWHLASTAVAWPTSL